MPKIRPNGSIRWASRTAAATPDYAAGIASPRTSWQQATVAAAGAQKDGIMQALADKRFEKGVAKAGDSKWQRGAQSKGVDRFGPGAQAGVEDYQTGFAPYAQVIESTQLPPRGPKGDPRNIQRVAVLAGALHKRKLSGFASLRLVSFCALLIAAIVVCFVATRSVASPASGGVGTEKRIKPKSVESGLTFGLGFSAALGLLGSVGLMGAALDLISASATQPNTGLALTAVTGDSLVIRSGSRLRSIHSPKRA